MKTTVQIKMSVETKIFKALENLGEIHEIFCGNKYRIIEIETNDKNQVFEFVRHNAHLMWLTNYVKV